jgi:signal transduction histidine kinase
MSVSEIAIKYPENEEVIENYKDDVLSISTRMKNIVESLLLLNKVNTEQFHLTMIDIDLSDKVLCILERLAITSPNLEQRINTDISDNIVITNDVFSLEAILTNLIHNAVYYSPEESKVSIELDIINKQPELKISNITLQNITIADIDNMFEPLWQKDQARTSETHFGLGLAIVRKLAERANIKISVKLDKDNVITFSVFF